MFYKFLLLQWKTATRSPMWQKSLILNIVVGFFLLIIGFDLLILGIFIEDGLKEAFPTRNHLEIFNGMLLYYFMADLMIRFMMQPLPTLTIESFLHLPVRKSTIIQYMMGRTVLDIFNLLPLLVLIPVTFRIAIPYGGTTTAVIWILTLLMLILANSFFSTFIKRMLGSKPWVTAGTGLFLATLVILDKAGIISISHISTRIFGLLTSNPLMLLIPFAWMLFSYLIHYNFLKIHLYPEEIQKRKHYEVQESATTRYLRSFGMIGTIISLEMKLYWRNKRTRTMVYMLPVFLLYGLIFYRDPLYMEQQKGFLLFVGVFMTGGMMLNYVNYAFAYESSYFDTLMTKNIDFNQYLTIKLYIAILISTICFILTIPYGFFFGLRILIINAAMYLYNIGILVYVLLYMATFNKSRMDLSRGGAFNYQGIGAMNWLAVLPAFLLPVLIYLPFSMAGTPMLGVAFIGLSGIIGLLFFKPVVQILYKSFYKRKYLMAAGFRSRV